MKSSSNSSEHIASIPDLEGISKFFQLESEAIQYLRDFGVLTSTMICGNCYKPMSYHERNFNFICNNINCRKVKVSVQILFLTA